MVARADHRPAPRQFAPSRSQLHRPALGRRVDRAGLGPLPHPRALHARQHRRRARLTRLVRISHGPRRLGRGPRRSGRAVAGAPLGPRPYPRDPRSDLRQHPRDLAADRPGPRPRDPGDRPGRSPRRPRRRTPARRRLPHLQALPPGHPPRDPRRRPRHPDLARRRA